MIHVRLASIGLKSQPCAASQLNNQGQVFGLKLDSMHLVPNGAIKPRTDGVHALSIVSSFTALTRSDFEVAPPGGDHALTPILWERCWGDVLPRLQETEVKNNAIRIGFTPSRELQAE